MLFDFMVWPTLHVSSHNVDVQKGSIDNHCSGAAERQTALATSCKPHILVRRLPENDVSYAHLIKIIIASLCHHPRRATGRAHACSYNVVKLNLQMWDTRPAEVRHATLVNFCCVLLRLFAANERRLDTRYLDITGRKAHVDSFAKGLPLRPSFSTRDVTLVLSCPRPMTHFQVRTAAPATPTGVSCGRKGGARDQPWALTRFT